MTAMTVPAPTILDKVAALFGKKPNVAQPTFENRMNRVADELEASAAVLKERIAELSDAAVPISEIVANIRRNAIAAKSPGGGNGNGGSR